MLYVSASILLTQDMATPKEMVDTRLAELGMSKADFARKLGYAGYQGYYDLFSAKRTQLTEKKLEEIAEVLGWPRDHFQSPGATLRRAEFIQSELAKFLATEVGREAHPETIKILRSMQFTGEVLPTAKLYRAVALAMEERYTPAQLLEATRLEQADAEAARKATPDGAATRKDGKRPRA